MTGSDTVAVSPPFGRPWSERFAGPPPRPIACGDRLEMREGIRALGLESTERQQGLWLRRIGPEPEAVIFPGALDPAITRLRVTFLVPVPPFPLERIHLLYEGVALELEVAGVPTAVTALVPQGWSIQARLPPIEIVPRPEWGRLTLHCDIPVDPQVPLSRWVGPGLHAIEFLG